MAKRLLERMIEIDAFIASPAKRARKTAEVFIKVYGEKKKDIIYIDSLYLASPSVFFDVISQASDDANTIAVFSHNDGITAFANMLTDTRIDNIPTCGIFAVKIHTDKWTDFSSAEKEFWFFDSPKANAE